MCFAQQTDFAARLFAMHFLGVFRTDSGGSAPGKMWFWFRKGYENLLFQIANILAIEGSIFNVFRELNLAKTRKGHPLVSSSESKRMSEIVFVFCFVSGTNGDSPPPSLWSLKTFKSIRKNNEPRHAARAKSTVADIKIPSNCPQLGPTKC